MKLDQQAEKEKRAMKEAVRYVRRDLLKFARDDRFSGDFAKALPHYWNDFYNLENAEEMSQDEALRFFDWFVFDYQPEAGQRLINIYLEEELENLSTPQQKVIKDWQSAGPSTGYELIDYDGQQLVLRDFLTGDEYEAYESSGRGNVEKGEIILTRLIPMQEHLEFSTTAAYLPADEIGDIKETFLAKRSENPDLSNDEFMRQFNHLLIHHALEQAQQKGRPAVARLDPDRADKKTQKIVRNMRRMKK